MNDTERYNGWTNRETWAVALHINNDQGWQESVHMELRSAAGWKDEQADGPHINATEAGEIIRENVEQMLSWLYDSESVETYALVRDDLGSLWRVNWTELGAAFLEDLDD